MCSRLFSSKSTILKPFRLLALIVFTVWLSACTTPAPFVTPQFSEVDQDVESLRFDEVRFYHIFDVRNAQAYIADIQRIDWNLSAGEIPLSSGTLEPGLRVEAGDVEALTIPLRIGYQDLQSRIGTFPEREDLPYQLRMIVRSASVPATEAESPSSAIDTLTFSGNFPLLQEPRAFVDTLMIHSFNLAIAQLEMRVRLVNPNAVPLTFNTGSYQLVVDGVTWHNQSISQNITIPAHSDIVLDTPFSMRPREFNTQVYRMLNMEQPFNFSMSGSFEIRANNPSFMRTHRWEFSSTGQHQFPRL